MLPNFVIIGAQKAATSFVRNCLYEHPDVFMVMKETPFFEDPYFHETKSEEFEKLFERGFRKKAVGFKRPDYLAKPECPERLHKYLPRTRLVVILRNPVERALAAYYYYLKKGKLPIRPFSEWFDKVCSGRPPESFIHNEIIEYGFYHRHLKRYMKFYDKERMFIMLHEDLKIRTIPSIRALYKFLDIDDRFIPGNVDNKVNKGIYSLNRLRIRNFMRIKNKGGIFDKVQAKSVNLIDKVLLSHIWNEPHPKLDAALFRELFDIYAIDVANLESLLERDLSGWKKWQ